VTSDRPHNRRLSIFSSDRSLRREIQILAVLLHRPLCRVHHLLGLNVDHSRSLQTVSSANTFTQAASRRHPTESNQTPLLSLVKHKEKFTERLCHREFRHQSEVGGGQQYRRSKETVEWVVSLVSRNVRLSIHFNYHLFQ
jgi:hypothetical protein